MMQEIYSEIFKAGIMEIESENHYTIDTNQLVEGTAVGCPFDPNLKVGKNEKGEVCIAKKSWFKPF